MSKDKKEAQEFASSIGHWELGSKFKQLIQPIIDDGTFKCEFRDSRLWYIIQSNHYPGNIPPSHPEYKKAAALARRIVNEWGDKSVYKHNASYMGEIMAGIVALGDVLLAQLAAQKMCVEGNSDESGASLYVMGVRIGWEHMDSFIEQYLDRQPWTSSLYFFDVVKFDELDEEGRNAISEYASRVVNNIIKRKHFQQHTGKYRTNDIWSTEESWVINMLATYGLSDLMERYVAHVMAIDGQTPEYIMKTVGFIKRGIKSKNAPQYKPVLPLLEFIQKTKLSPYDVESIGLLQETRQLILSAPAPAPATVVATASKKRGRGKGKEKEVTTEMQSASSSSSSTTTITPSVSPVAAYFSQFYGPKSTLPVPPASFVSELITITSKVDSYHTTTLPLDFCCAGCTKLVLRSADVCKLAHGHVFARSGLIGSISAVNTDDFCRHRFLLEPTMCMCMMHNMHSSTPSASYLGYNYDNYMYTPIESRFQFYDHRTKQLRLIPRPAPPLTYEAALETIPRETKKKEKGTGPACPGCKMNMSTDQGEQVLLNCKHVLCADCALSYGVCPAAGCNKRVSGLFPIRDRTDSESEEEYEEEMRERDRIGAHYW
eukprot:TRINITY_DN3878_c0_g1_i4.p1 TRINITY_DN3878_c0_g1~~TRINITY_DN3878_c0_g1_i4.p1  ORF type:complete len:601 (-),score=100.84 TRINITY_DN3878_c0_g1_i4:106-1908(-)